MVTKLPRDHCVLVNAQKGYWLRIAPGQELGGVSLDGLWVNSEYMEMKVSSLGDTLTPALTETAASTFDLSVTSTP